ncbi:Coenzyme F420 hydrogenase/dehydrogenase, beta subunit C-terminal domain [Rossellomorea marisflavi]|uniref:Coenzyme F420 hydrogenase/dehydrogenase, beta subunit C-terminal domain n=1 Tax=Rossellomorea marisflavi TaxID=189381 RepID=UPI00345A1501
MDLNISRLFEEVVDNNFCIGCGVCAAIKGSPLKMSINNNGQYIPTVGESSSDMEINPLEVCPFSNSSKNEDEIGLSNFGDIYNINKSEYEGYYLKSFAGYVKEGGYRKNGSSGGMATWIASQLLQRNLVDGIIHVKSSEGAMLFNYQISYSVDSLINGSKSKYYPVEMSEVIKKIKNGNKRYAIIGIPCFIKSLRLLASKDEILRKSLKYYIGLVCGHLKSEFFAKSIGLELGILPDKLSDIDFRVKKEKEKANNYNVSVTSKDGSVIEESTKKLQTTNWGQGYFKYNACEYCDDVLAETADITIGDAWLPKYTKDSMGTNLIIVRNKKLLEIIEESSEKLLIEEISSKEVYTSQAGGFRHRREGLAYRLHLKDINNEIRPTKRVAPSNKVKYRRKRIYKLRLKLAEESFVAYKIAQSSGDFKKFQTHLSPLLNDYNQLMKPSVSEKIIKKIKYEFGKISKK